MRRFAVKMTQMNHVQKMISCLAMALMFSIALPYNVYAQNDIYKAALDSLFHGFKTRDYGFIKPLLDTNVKLASLPRGMSDMVVPQVLRQFPEAATYKVEGIEKNDSGIRVRTTYTYINGTTRPQSFLFDANRKIIDFDVFNGMQTRATKMASPTEFPDHFEVPFELHSKVIFVKAMLNGREEYFILDSGSPMLVLNADAMEEGAVARSEMKAQGVGGSVGLRTCQVSSFNWNGIKLDSFSSVAISLKHLEKATHHKFAGLIGYQIFKNYAVTYDYNRMVLTFVRTDEKGEPVVHSTDESGYSIVPFELHAHIPVFTASVGDRTYKMGLDCGASSELLYAKHMEDISDHISHIRKRRLEGAGQNVTRVPYGKISGLQVGGIAYPEMLFAFENATLDQLNNGYSNLGIDGLLGYDFLKEHKTIVNYRKGEMRIAK